MKATRQEAEKKNKCAGADERNTDWLPNMSVIPCWNGDKNKTGEKQRLSSRAKPVSVSINPADAFNKPETLLKAEKVAQELYTYDGIIAEDRDGRSTASECDRADTVQGHTRSVYLLSKIDPPLAVPQ